MSTRRAAVAALLTATALAVSLLGFAATSAGADGTGTIKGRIIDRDTGTPIAGACATVKAGTTTLMSEPTRRDGRYEITNVPAGAWKMFAADCTDQDETYVAQVWHGHDGLDETDADLVSVVDGATTAPISFRLREGGNIAVTTRDKHGNAIGGIWVCPFYKTKPQQVSDCVLTMAFEPVLIRGVFVGKNTKLLAYGNADWQSTWFDKKNSFEDANKVAVFHNAWTNANLTMQPVTAAARVNGRR